MFRMIGRRGPLALLLALAACTGLTRCSGPAPMDRAAFEALYAAPLQAPEGPLAVYHLGHSLVGRDMPAMLAQLAGAGHGYDSQLGWGTTLKAHWEPGEEIAGFETENDHPRHRPAGEALDSGDYGALVLTEMVEIRDALRYFDSPGYLGRWTTRARAARPDIRVYLYETWHRLDDAEGWLERLDADRARYWEDGILRPAATDPPPGGPVHVIPAGQVMARFVRAAEAGGALRREDLFAREADGSLDTIHLNDIGAYLVALTHYAVLYHRSPEGLPHRLTRADGSPADAPDAQTARLMQEIVWRVVTEDPMTGIAGATKAETE